MLKILVAESDRKLRREISEELKKEDVNVFEAEDSSSAINLCKKTKFDVVIMDLKIPKEQDGFNLLKKVKQILRYSMVIILSLDTSHEMAVEALKLGADDYLPRDFLIDKLKIQIQKYAREKHFKRNHQKLVKEHIRLQRELIKSYGFKNFIGESKAINKVKKSIRMVADRPESVLIIGEPGVGKEMAARAIHYSSYRRKRPFIVMNCAHIPENLMEQELFGQEKYTFPESGNKFGRFELANNGTILLDEVSYIPLPLQAKIMEVLKTGGFTRVEGADTIYTDVRIVATSTQRLESLVKSKKFNKELYSLLNAITIEIPPLRERVEDIPLLINHFLLKHRRDTGVKISKVTAPTLHFLVNYSWPGNVRELDQVLRRALFTCKTNLLRIENVDWLYDREKEEEQNIPAHFSTETTSTQSTTQDNNNTIVIPNMSFDDTEKVYEKFIAFTETALFEQILKRTKGNVRKAARQLGISRTTLRTKIEKYNLTGLTRKRVSKTGQDDFKESKPKSNNIKKVVQTSLRISKKTKSLAKASNGKKNKSKKSSRIKRSSSKTRSKTANISKTASKSRKGRGRSSR